MRKRLLASNGPASQREDLLAKLPGLEPGSASPLPSASATPASAMATRMVAAGAENDAQKRDGMAKPKKEAEEQKRKIRAWRCPFAGLKKTRRKRDERLRRALESSSSSEVEDYRSSRDGIIQRHEGEAHEVQFLTGAP